MTQTHKFFVSCVESRSQDQGSLYARFHIGTFVGGQALTLGNALRRTLLSEVPGVVLTDVVIDGVDHEFATLPGVEEPVLDILLNLKKLVFAPCISTDTELENFRESGFLKRRGPAKLTAADLKLPGTIKILSPTAHIATLTSGEEFSLRFQLAVQTPHSSLSTQAPHLSQGDSKKLTFETLAMPVQKVNYVIKPLHTKQHSEYLIFEIWTDGSILPQEALQFSLKRLTQLFYQFTSLADPKNQGICYTE